MVLRFTNIDVFLLPVYLISPHLQILIALVEHVLIIIFYNYILFIFYFYKTILFTELQIS